VADSCPVTFIVTTKHNKQMYVIADGLLMSRTIHLTLGHVTVMSAVPVKKFLLFL